MATAVTLYSKGGTTTEALAPSTTAAQVAITSEGGTGSTVEAEIVLLRQKVNAAVDAGIHFRGEVTSTKALPTVAYKSGWMYIVKEAGIYAGNTCEVGDLILCISDYASGSASNSDWSVLQANLSGSLSGPASSVAGNVVIFGDTSGKIVKDSGIQVLKSVPADAVFTDHIYNAATASADGLMTVAQFNKLAGIEAGADKTDATNVAAAGAFMKASDTSDNIVEGSTKKLMTAAERTKLSEISAGAEVNQMAFSNVRVGTTTIAAGSKTDTVEIAAGEGITLTPDASGKKVSVGEAYIDSCVVPSLDDVPANLRNGGLIIVRA